MHTALQHPARVARPDPTENMSHDQAPIVLAGTGMHEALGTWTAHRGDTEAQAAHPLSETA